MLCCRLSVTQKNLLLMEIINAAAKEETSLVDTSFDLLVMQHFEGNEKNLYTWIPKTSDKGMDDFVDQCITLAEKLESFHNKEQKQVNGKRNNAKTGITKTTTSTAKSNPDQLDGLTKTKKSVEYRQAETNLIPQKNIKKVDDNNNDDDDKEYD